MASGSNDVAVADGSLVDHRLWVVKDVEEEQVVMER